MRDIRDILLALLLVTLLVGCDKDSSLVDGGATIDMPLNSLSASRSDGETWDEGEAIGLMMHYDGEAVGLTNVCYGATESGANINFSSAASPLYYPEAGSADIIAYYPYDEDITSHDTLNIDVEELAENLLVASEVSSSYGETTTLEFAPLLSLIEFNFSVADSFDPSKLEGLQFSIDGLISTASYNLISGELELGAAAGAINVQSAATTTRATSTTLSTMVIPQTLSSDDAVIASVALSDGTTFSSILSLSSIESGMVYSYSATVSDSGVEFESLSIKPWSSGTTQSGVAEKVPAGYTAISTDEELSAYFAQETVSSNYILMADVTLEFDAACPYVKTLSHGAIFDGNGHTIDLKYSGADIYSYLNLYLFYVNKGTIQNLCVDMSMKLKSSLSYFEIGMVRSNGDDLTQSVTNCGVIKNCTVTGDIYAMCELANAPAYIGSIATYSLANSQIYNCYSDCNITIDMNNDSQTYYVGGITGYCYEGAIIKNICYTGVIYDESSTVITAGLGSIAGHYAASSDFNDVSTWDNIDYIFTPESKNKILNHVGNVDDVDYTDNTILRIADESMQSMAFAQVLNNVAYGLVHSSDEDVDNLASWSCDGSYPQLNTNYEATYSDYAGLGTKEYPYYITSAEDLVTLSNEVAAGDDKSGVYYSVDNNIVLSNFTSDWVPIGTEETHFQGHVTSMNGETPRITVNINTYNVQLNGLFGVLGWSATIENIHVDGLIVANYYVGGIAAKNYGTISNCVNYATISTSGAFSYIGGIVAVNMGDKVASAYDGKVTNCSNEGVVQEMGSYVTIGTVVGVNMAGSDSVSGLSSTTKASILGYSTTYNSSYNYIIGATSL